MGALAGIPFRGDFQSLAGSLQTGQLESGRLQLAGWLGNLAVISVLLRGGRGSTKKNTTEPVVLRQTVFSAKACKVGMGRSIAVVCTPKDAKSWAPSLVSHTPIKARNADRINQSSKTLSCC